MSLSETFASFVGATEGTLACPCIDATPHFLTRSNCVTDTFQPGFWHYTNNGEGTCFPVTYGSEVCAPHDLDVHPGCRGENPPDFCHDSFCFVDPEKCKLSPAIFGLSDLFPESKLYYSYSTCNSSETNWMLFQSTETLENKTITLALPDIWYPGHYKLNADGDVAEGSGPEYYNNSIPWVGWIVDYLEALREISNIRKFEYTFRSVGSDSLYSSGWTASVHDVQSGISETGLGSYWITSERLQMAPFTTPVATDNFYLWVKKPTSSGGSFSENAAKVMSPFTREVWILFVTCVLGVALLTMLFANRHGHRKLWWQKLRDTHWVEGSWWYRMLIFLRILFDSFLEDATMAFGHSASFDIHSNLSTKILNFGFGFFILIIVAAYTANLAAFLTLASTGDYINSINDAIESKAPMCVHPVLFDDFVRNFPDGIFVTSGETSELFLEMFENYDKGLCEALIFGTFDILSSVLYTTNMCDREIVRASSIVVLSNSIGFPTTPGLNAGISHWITEAEKQGISFTGFNENARPNPACVLEMPEEDIVDELVPLTPSNFGLPFIVLVSCAVLATLIFLANRSAAKQNTKSDQSLKKAFSLFKLRVPRSSQVSEAPRFSMQPPTATSLSMRSQQQQLEVGEFSAGGVWEAMQFLEDQMNMWRTELREGGVVPDDQPQTTVHQEAFAEEN